MTILRYWFTGRDNESYEIMRALTALSIIAMLFYIGWHLIVNKTFDPMAAGTGLGGLLLGGGLGTATKDGTIGKATKVAGDLNADNIETVVTGDKQGG